MLDSVRGVTMVILCKRGNCPPSDTTSHLGRNEFSALRWHDDLVIVLLMAAVQHLVRLARPCRLLCVPAALSPCTCDAGASDCCTIVASVCCILLPTINVTFVMGHGFLSLTSTCHVTHVLYFENSVKFVVLTAVCLIITSLCQCTD